MRLVLAFFAVFLSRIDCGTKMSVVGSVASDLSCEAEKTVEPEKQHIEEFSQPQFSIYCKPGKGFAGIQIEVNGSEGVHGSAVLTDEELGTSNVSRWYHLGVDFSFSYHISVAYKWYVRISVDNGLVRERYLALGSVREEIEKVRVVALGASRWRTRKPADSCEEEADITPATSGSGSNAAQWGRGGADGPSCDAKIWTLVGIFSFISMFLVTGIIVLLWMVKQQETCVLPRVGVEAEDDLNYEVRYANGGNTSVTRPGSAHDSENSLYGAL
ncbi:uncharacterized protein [Macrobrachium rosenbergii]|uniref:uncharacterized protein isoform X2 n=1 Tax=Macrobrachium rosenbergii TaxID=79674 RepID=UPI0034D5EAFD